MTVSFTGHRPSKMCGYDAAAYMDFVQRLARFLAELKATTSWRSGRRIWPRTSAAG